MENNKDTSEMKDILKTSDLVLATFAVIRKGKLIGIEKGRPRSTFVIAGVPKETRDEFLQKVYEVGYENERKFGGCTQCTLLALQKMFDLSDGAVFKSAHSLCGGAGLSGKGTCGALTGGIMAIGLKYGRDKTDIIIKDVNLKKNKKNSESHLSEIGLKSHKLSKRLVDGFLKEYGSIICEDIQKKIIGRSFNIWDKEDYKEFKKAGAHIDKCPSVVGNASKWVAEIFLEESG